MKEHGIIFSSAMVRAILAGQKTQTRRLIKPQPDFLQIHTWKGETLYDCEHRVWGWKNHLFPDALVDCHGSNTLGEKLAPFAPHGPVGRRLWCREAHQIFYVAPERTGREDWSTGENLRVSYPATDGRIEFMHDDKGLCDDIRPSIHMPRWASRITLEVTRVRVERVQDITEEDAKAEGVEPSADLPPGYIDGLGVDITTSRGAFAHLWEKIDGTWRSNPWVFVYDFRRVA